MRTAVVTGAGSGLGRATALELAGRGFAVWAADLDGAAASETAARIAAPGGGADRTGTRIGSGAGTTHAGRAEAHAATLDVRDEADCRSLADAVLSDAGRLDLWVNNAGVFFTGPAWAQSAEQRRAMFDVNAAGLVNGTLAALGPMREAGRGHVVNVVSLAGIVAAPGEVVYSASKHAALAFTLGTQFDLRRAGERGVRLSAICPDGIWTPMLEDKLDDPEAAGSFSGRLLRVEEVARELGRLAERPRPLVIVPRWRGPLLRFFDLFPGLSLRLVPLVMWDARRRQRSYRRQIESRRWP